MEGLNFNAKNLHETFGVLLVNYFLCVTMTLNANKVCAQYNNKFLHLLSSLCQLVFFPSTKRISKLKIVINPALFLHRYTFTMHRPTVHNDNVSA